MEKKVIEKIVSKTGYSESHVRNVVLGHRNNKTISTMYNQLTTVKAVKKVNTKKAVKATKTVQTKNSLITKIAEKSGYSESHVRNVINGSRYNETISKLYSKLYSKYAR